MSPSIIGAVPDSTSVKITWVSNSLMTVPATYTVERTAYPATATSTWVSATATPTPAGGLNYTATGLAKCTNYVFRVKANCSATVSSAWSTSLVSKTTGCVVAPPVCVAPTFITVTSDTTTASLSWTAGIQGASYTVEYTVSPVTNTSNWTAVNATTNSKTITGLSACTVYVFRVKANCSATNASAWSAVRDSKTKGCVVVVPCIAPTIGNIVTDTTKATLSWGNGTVPTAGTTYTVEYTVAPVSATSTWTAVTATTNTTTITGLSACTNYIFRVKANCSATTSSAWSSLRDSKTKGCVVILPCLSPNITNTVTDSTKATLTWVSSAAGANAPSYTVEYTTIPVGANNVWTAVTATASPYTVTGLTACTEYAFRVKANCSATASSSWSNYGLGKTKGCVVVVPCLVPTIGTIVTDTTKAILTWGNGTAPSAGTTYTVEYTVAPASATSTWTAVTANTNTATITGLSACTNYMFRVKANCSATTSSAWSSLRDSKTKGCVVVVPCSAPVIGNITADSTKISFSWTAGGAGTTYVVEYTAAPVTTTSTWTAVTVTTNSATISGLATCSYYAVRVKAICSATSSSAWSIVRDTKTKGCVVVVPCIVPAIGNITTDSTKATLSWGNGAPSTGNSYIVEYTTAPVTTTSTWTAVTVAVNTATITGLSTCTEYVFRVKAVCSATSSSAWSVVRDAKTKGCAAPTCTKPTNLTSTTTNTSAVLAWTGTGSFFQVRYRAFTGSSAWNTADSVTTNTLTANNLKKCTTYIWQVRTRCANATWTPWSDYKVFKTTGCTSTQSLTIAPNPSTGLNLAYTLPAESKVSVEVVNIQGSVIKTLEVGTQYAGDNQFKADDMDIQAGIYFIVMKIDGVQQQVQRWIKE
jgi:Fibronectin type III domain